MDMHMPMDMDMDDCCDDEWALEIIEDKQQLSDNLSAPSASYFVLYEVALAEFLISEELESQQTFFKDQGPPDVGAPPLYLFYHNLKIPADLQS